MIGPSIREWREGRGMPQSELTHHLGISQGTLSRIESGERTPSIDLMLRVCRALDITPNDLLLPEKEAFNGNGTHS